MSTHNIGFYKDLTEIILNYHKISSNTYLISSAEPEIDLFFPKVYRFILKKQCVNIFQCFCVLLCHKIHLTIG